MTNIVLIGEFMDQITKLFENTDFLLSPTQWLYLGSIVLAAFTLSKIFDVITKAILDKKFPDISNNPNNHIKKFVTPMGYIFMTLAIVVGIQFLDLRKEQSDVLERVLLVLFSVNVIWVGHYLIHLLTHIFKEKAKRTDNKFDDILIPLLSKSAFVILYALGIVYVLHNLTINVTGIIAGLGIGGLAFAFAAKDAIANFFGSAMLVLDRPFDIGDYIVVGSIEGTVEEVGFRSTRIRTFYDSMVTVSNGQLMNQSIDNKGKRRYRRLNTTLGLEYDTPPEKIEAFCEGIRQLILEHKWTRKDNFHVYFTNFGASSLDITLVVFWTTEDYAREQAEKHRLMIDILRLSKEIGVDFAFPTQTVHMFNGHKVEKQNEFEKYIDEGISRAKKIVEQPISLKNPRSNFSDKKQFGENDIGL